MVVLFDEPWKNCNRIATLLVLLDVLGPFSGIVLDCLQRLGVGGMVFFWFSSFLRLDTDCADGPPRSPPMRYTSSLKLPSLFFSNQKRLQSVVQYNQYVDYNKLCISALGQPVDAILVSGMYMVYRRMNRLRLNPENTE